MLRRQRFGNRLSIRPGAPPTARSRRYLPRAPRCRGSRTPTSCLACWPSRGLLPTAGTDRSSEAPAVRSQFGSPAILPCSPSALFQCSGFAVSHVDDLPDRPEHRVLARSGGTCGLETFTERRPVRRATPARRKPSDGFAVMPISGRRRTGTTDRFATAGRRRRGGLFRFARRLDRLIGRPAGCSMPTSVHPNLHDECRETREARGPRLAGFAPLRASHDGPLLVWVRCGGGGVVRPVGDLSACPVGPVGDELVEVGEECSHQHRLEPREPGTRQHLRGTPDRRPGCLHCALRPRHALRPVLPACQPGCPGRPGRPGARVPPPERSPSIARSATPPVHDDPWR